MASPESSLLPSEWDLPTSIRGRIGREAGPQRAISEEGHLLLILHQLPAPDQTERVPSFFWRNRLGAWKSHPATGGVSVLEQLFLSYKTRLLELERMEETAAHARDYHTVLAFLAPILRAARGLHRAMQQAREAIKEDPRLIDFRDSAASLERTAELMLQDAQFGLNYTTARQAEAQAEAAQRMAQTAHRLNVLAAVFLPVTALAGIFSMNVHSGVEDTRVNFVLIVTASLCAGLTLGYLINRRP